ncbi:MAG: M1 family peptidase, partial [Vicingaceae bacterium]
DWFWRGWFFTTDHCDIAIDNVEWFKIDTRNPSVEKAIAKELKAAESIHIGVTRNEDLPVYSDHDKEILDFYNTYDPFEPTLVDQEEYDKYMTKLNKDDVAILEADYNYYSIDFANKGGLVMPIILNFTFTDGSTEEVRIPAEIWKTNHLNVSKTFFFKKEVVSVDMDPWLETADVNLNDNNWPRKTQLSKFQVFKQKETNRRGNGGSENLMQRDARNEELKKK